MKFASCHSEGGNGNEEGRQYIALDERSGEIVWNLRDVECGSGKIQFYGDDIISMHRRRVIDLDRFELEHFSGLDIEAFQIEGFEANEKYVYLKDSDKKVHIYGW